MRVHASLGLHRYVYRKSHRVMTIERSLFFVSWADTLDDKYADIAAVPGICAHATE